MAQVATIKSAPAPKARAQKAASAKAEPRDKSQDTVLAVYDGAPVAYLTPKGNLVVRNPNGFGTITGDPEVVRWLLGVATQALATYDESKARQAAPAPDAREALKGALAGLSKSQIASLLKSL